MVFSVRTCTLCSCDLSSKLLYLELDVSVGAEGGIGEARGRHRSAADAPEVLRRGTHPAVQEAQQEQGAVEDGDGVEDGVHECGYDPEPECTADVHGSG